MGLLRGTTDGERTPGDPSHGVAHVQGRLPAVPGDDGSLRPAQGGLGLSRPPGRARGREGDRHEEQARHRGVRHRGVQPPLPGVGAALRRRVRATDRTARLLDRHRRRVLDDGHRVHRERVVVAEAAARDEACWSRPTGSRRTARGAAPRCPTPRSRWATRRSRTRASTSASASWRHPTTSLVGASLLGWTTTPWTLDLERRARGGATMPPTSWSSTAATGGSSPSLARSGAPGRIPSSVGPCRAPRSSELGTSRCTRTSRARIASSRRTSSRWRTAPAIVHLAPAFGAEDLEIGRREGWPVFKPLDGEGRFTDEAPSFVRGMFFKDADPAITEDLRSRGLLLRDGDDRAHLSLVLAMRHAADLHRADLLVHPDDGGEGPAARRERGGRVVPRAHQARPLRRLAREQRRLGALARALLGHAAADLAVPERPRHGDRLARWSSRSARDAT